MARSRHKTRDYRKHKVRSALARGTSRVREAWRGVKRRLPKASGRVVRRAVEQAARQTRDELEKLYHEVV